MDLIDRAEMARIRCRYGEARDLYEEALAMGQSVPEAHLGLGHVLRMEGRFDEALRHYREVQADRKGEAWKADARMGEALALRALCRHRESLAILASLTDLYEAEDDEEGLAYSLWATGGALRIAGRFPEALEALASSLAVYRSLQDQHGQTYTHCGLGGVSRALGDYAGSLYHYTEANTLAREREDLFAISYSCCGLGNVQRMEGNFPDALDLFREAEEGYDRLGDRVSYAYTVWSMATVHKIEGRCEQAGEAFQRCLRFFEDTGDPRGRVYALTGLAELEGDPKPLALCRDLADSFALAWEALLVETTGTLLRGEDLSRYEERYASFGTAWRPAPPALNIP